MTTFQKVINYLAIAFAFFLIFSILFGIVYGVKSVYYIFNDSDKVADKFYEIPIQGEVLDLDIDVNYVNLIIKNGDTLKVETNNNYINGKQNDSKFVIEEKDIKDWFNKENTDLVVYIPNNTLFNKVSINNGAGKVDIDSLSTNKLDLELGAGKLSINDLEVLEKTEIDGGAGSISIKDGSVKNLDLDIGVGKVEFNSLLLGNTDIDCGIGELNLNIKNSKDNYKIIPSKGIGSFKIDGKSIKNDTTYGSGNNIIEIDVGIGSVNVNFTN